MICRYPKQTNEFAFLAAMSVLYIAAGTGVELPPINYQIFGNDLSQPDVLNWLFFQLVAEISIFVLSKEACARIENKTIKAIFYAVCVDSVFTGIYAVLFGYSSSVSATFIRALFTVSSMFYAYIVLHERHVKV